MIPIFANGSLTMLAKEGINVDLAKSSGDVTELLETHSTDAVVVSRSQLTEDRLSSLDNSVDEGPGVIVLDKEEDAQDRAQLLAAGASAVLDAKKTNPDLGEDLVTIARAGGGWWSRRPRVWHRIDRA